MLEVSDISKVYGTRTVVDHVSFTVPKGEILGFLGPNGAGKTTTMRIITGYVPPTSGTAKVAGFDVQEQPLEVKRRLGYLPEHPPLYPEMLVRSYLEFTGRIRGVPRRQLKARTDRAIERCGLQAVAGRLIAVLSKGYQQRVGLAQAILHEPDLLILDEPTVGLDPNQIVEIRDLIRTIGKERTVILSTHILSEVEATCGRVIIVDDGRIVASGTPAELASQAHGGTYYLVSTRAPETLAAPRLRAVPGVVAVKTEGTRDGLVQLRVDCGEKADLGEAIFQTVVKNGWTLAELRRETASLEHVFRQLTGREK